MASSTRSSADPMSQEPPLLVKSVRKGARSCIECRHRKLRCVWRSEGSEEACERCAASQRVCEPQVHMVPTSVATVTARTRIRALQSEVSSLWTAVRTLEARLGGVPPGDGEAASPQPPLPPRTESAGGPHYQPSEDGEDDGDSVASDLSPLNPPSHLLQLFDNGLLGSCEDGSATPSRHALSLHQAQRSYALRRLLPSRADMLPIAAHASSWLSLHNALFPISTLTKTSGEMLARYDQLQDPNADPVAIADLLLSIAITVQQAPDDTAGRAAESIRDAPSFVKEVSDAVERIVISDDDLCGSLQGIAATLLFLRLQLGRARVRKMWLLTKRAIALAELLGLPRAAMALASRGAQPGASPSLVESWREKAGVWESICAIDRIASMMWSLPLATVNYPLPKRPIVDSQGQVNPQSYLYSLADIASRVLELDNIYASGKPLVELFNAAMETDQELRSLASLTPKRWRKIHWPELSIDALLQYWHQYLTVRTHLQLALRYYEGQEFAFNFVTCLDACQELARRYISMRPVFPAGFFAIRVIDLQAFTATVFLLLASYRTTRSSGTSVLAVDVNVTTGLVDQVVRMMGLAADRTGGDFARQAADAVRSLTSLLQQSQTSELQNITLNLALVGKIHVSRKSYAAKPLPKPSYPTPNQQSQGPWQAPTSCDAPAPSAQGMPPKSSGLDLMDSLSYSMEVPENYPFLTDETFGTEQWLTWTGDGTIS